jgi:hypothetical protein
LAKGTGVSSVQDTIFLLIDLTTNELNHQDIDQADFYVSYFEDKMRQKDDNPTKRSDPWKTHNSPYIYKPKSAEGQGVSKFFLNFINFVVKLQRN